MRSSHHSVPKYKYTLYIADYSKMSLYILWDTSCQVKGLMVQQQWFDRNTYVPRRDPGAYHCNQHTRWTQKPCVPLCFHTILGSQYWTIAYWIRELQYMLLPRGATILDNSLLNTPTGLSIGWGTAHRKSVPTVTICSRTVILSTENRYLL